MKRVEVLRPFRVGDKDYDEVGKEVTLPSDVVERLLKINVNMVLVKGDVKPKKKTESKK